MTRNAKQPSKLTYERLITKLNHLIAELADHHPDAKENSRVDAIRTTINTGISSAHAGLKGDTSVATAGKLKHEVMAEIQDVHKRFDAATKIIKYAGMGRKNLIEAYNGPDKSDTEAGSSGPTTKINAGVETEKPLSSPGMRDAAAILQSLYQERSQSQQSTHPVDRPDSNKPRINKSAVTKRLIASKPLGKLDPAKAPIEKSAVTKRTVTRKTLSTPCPGPAPTTRRRSTRSLPLDVLTPSSPKRKRNSDEVSIASFSTAHYTPPSSDGPSSSPKRAKYDYIPVPPTSSFANMSAEQIFFLGVEYGIENAFNEAKSTLGPKGHFRNYVMGQLGLQIVHE